MIRPVLALSLVVLLTSTALAGKPVHLRALLAKTPAFQTKVWKPSGSGSIHPVLAPLRTMIKRSPSGAFVHGTPVSRSSKRYYLTSGHDYRVKLPPRRGKKVGPGPRFLRVASRSRR